SDRYMKASSRLDLFKDIQRSSLYTERLDSDHRSWSKSQNLAVSKWTMKCLRWQKGSLN
ncbi:hypothetical protein ACOME3_000716, partial [Neoechinorhynchus agilis]